MIKYKLIWHVHIYTTNYVIIRKYIKNSQQLPNIHTELAIVARQKRKQNKSA